MARKANTVPTARPPKETVEHASASGEVPSYAPPVSAAAPEPKPEPMPDYVRIHKDAQGVVIVTRI